MAVTRAAGAGNEDIIRPFHPIYLVSLFCRLEDISLEDARLLFEQMIGYANHLGLYSEQTGASGEALGNFPQAFTHLALISAAFNLDRTLGPR